MNRVLRAAIAGLAIVAALALTACGNDEENDYIDEVNAQTEELEASINEAAAEIRPDNPQAALDAFEQSQDAIAANADALEGIDPPEAVAELHARLVETTRSVADTFAEFQDALGGNVQRLADAAQELQSELTATLSEQSQIIDDINAEFGN